MTTFPGDQTLYELYPQSYKRLQISQFSTYIFSADIKPEMLKLCRVTLRCYFQCWYAFLILANFILFEFLTYLKGLLGEAQTLQC